MEANSQNTRRPSKPRQGLGARIRGAARVLFYGAFVCVGMSVLAARSAYGDVVDSGLAIGSELGKLGDGPTRPVRLNGERIFVAAQTDEQPFEKVLDGIENACKRDSAAIFSEIADLSEIAKQRVPIDLNGAQAAGVVRKQTSRRGYVACFGGAATGSATEKLTKRLKAFADSGDLGAIGSFRYVYAERLDDERTHIVAAWTQGSFNVHSLIPKAGDTPGTDPRNAPRPPNAVRLLTADMEGAPYAVRVYESTRKPADVLSTYDAEMPSRGWAGVEAVNSASQDPRELTAVRAYRHGGVDFLIVAEPHREGSVVTLIESRADAR